MWKTAVVVLFVGFVIYCLKQLRTVKADREKLMLAGLVVLISLLLSFLGNFQPMILIGKSGEPRSKLLFLQSLNQVEAKVGFMAITNSEVWAHLNWDDPWLLLDGYCWGCGKPYAPKGTFVIAALPKGLAFTCRANGQYDHMTTPTYVWRTTVIVIGCTIATIIAISPIRKWRRRRLGMCRICGYNLLHNQSGVCSECGATTSQ